MIYHVNTIPKVYRKKNGMKEKRLHTDPVEVRRELQKVADELGLPLNDCRVCYEWSQRGNCWDKRVSDELMAKLYFPIGKIECSELTIETMEQRLFQIAKDFGIDVMEWRVIEEYLKRYDNKFPRVITREVLSLYFDYNDNDCIPINPKRKRVGDGFHSY